MVIGCRVDRGTPQPVSRPNTNNPSVQAIRLSHGRFSMVANPVNVPMSEQRRAPLSDAIKGGQRRSAGNRRHHLGRSARAACPCPVGRRRGDPSGKAHPSGRQRLLPDRQVQGPAEQGAFLSADPARSGPRAAHRLYPSPSGDPRPAPDRGARAPPLNALVAPPETGVVGAMVRAGAERPPPSSGDLSQSGPRHALRLGQPLGCARSGPCLRRRSTARSDRHPHCLRRH